MKNFALLFLACIFAFGAFAQEKQFFVTVEGETKTDSIWMNPDTTYFTTPYLLHNGNPIVSTKTVNVYNLLLSYHADSAAKYGEQDDYMFKDAFTKGDRIYIPKWDRDYNIEEEVTIPEGLELIFADGAMINVTGLLKGNYTTIDAGNVQIFTEASNLSTERLDWDVSLRVRPEWFGAIPDGESDCTPAIQKCLDVFHQNVYLSGYDYRVNGTLHLNSYNSIEINPLTFISTAPNSSDPLFRITRSPFVIRGGVVLVSEGYTGWIFDVGIDKTDPNDRIPRFMSQIGDMIVKGQDNLGVANFHGNAYKGLRVKSTKESDFSYFAMVNAIDFYRPDTGIFLSGNPVSGMSNSWHFNNVTVDWPMRGIVLDSRAAGHVFTNLIIQTNTLYKGVMLDISSKYNFFNGMIWDLHSDSTIVLRKIDGTYYAAHNWIGNFGRFDMYERFTKDETDFKAFNTFITANPFEPTYNGINYTSKQYLGIGIHDNRNPNNVTMAHLQVKDDDFPSSVFIRKTTATGGSYDGLTGTSGEALAVVGHSTGVLEEGFGTQMTFVMKGSGQDTTTFATNIMARIVARREGGNARGALQFFTKDQHAVTPSMTIRNTGNVGIGTTNPTEVLEVNGNIKANSVITTSPMRAASVSIDKVLSLTPQSSPPASPKTGDLYVSTDGHIYCYLNGTWKQLD
jgi:hypothetical protein